MVRIRKILLVVVSVLVGIFFILPLIGVGILKWAVLPPEKLTPLVVEKTNEFIEAHLECERKTGSPTERNCPDPKPYASHKS